MTKREINILIQYVVQEKGAFYLSYEEKAHLSRWIREGIEKAKCKKCGYRVERKEAGK